MNVLVKERVVELRRRGKTYGEISEATGMPVGSIKSICRRTPNTPAAEVVGECGQCKKALTGSGARRFCSKDCRLAWWHEHPERLDRKAIYTFTCAGCQTRFSAYGNKARKYCTHACYVKTRFGTRGGRS